MTREKNKSEKSVILRRQAEGVLKKKLKSLKSSSSLPENETLRLFHELEVHQLELEMQNDELMLAKSELQTAAEKYTRLYDIAPAGYFTLAPAGEIIELNACGAELLGKDRRQLIDSSFGFFVSEDTKPVFNSFLENVFAGKAKKSCEVTLILNEDQQLLVHITGIAIENKKQCLIAVIDISEAKQTEDALRNFQKLESIGILASGIAHDFNNLMGGIFGYIDLALEETDLKKISKYLSHAMNTINRARALTQQLLTFAKGGAPVQKTGQLFPLIQEIANFSLSGANISCKFQLQKGLWPCSFDQNQISQVIENLIINAKQAMPAGGTIELSASNVRIENKEHPILENNDYVKISIKDQGIGIPKDQINHIFDPFFSTKEKGHGLGLATSYSIIHRHGGYIDVNSEPGKGSTFNVYLPAAIKAESPELENQAETSYKPAQRNGVFLIMDDEKVMRETMSDMLNKLGYSVVCKENGQDAIDFFLTETKAKREIAGLILDLTIPQGKGGKAVAAKIREFDKDIPLFVTSGYADDPIMKNPQKYVFTDSISKPFRKEELSKMLSKYLK
jgi:PAS domain S-box-containing protein